jgi:hypothetical protein
MRGEVRSRPAGQSLQQLFQVTALHPAQALRTPLYRRRGRLFLGTDSRLRIILPKAKDQRAEWHAERSIDCFRLWCRIVGQEFNSDIGIAHWNDTGLLHGRSANRSTPDTVGLPSLMSSCFLSHSSGSELGTTSRTNLITVSELQTLSRFTDTGSFSKDVMPLLRSKRVSLLGVSTGKLIAPRRNSDGCEPCPLEN